MRILIIEQEQEVIKDLECILQGISADVATSHCTDIPTARNWFRKNTHPQLVFSAITFPDGLSFDLFRSLKNNPPVVYMNTNDRFALEAFKQNGLYYLLKPLDKTEVEKAVSRYRYLHPQEPAPAVEGNRFQDRFLVTVGKQVKLVKADEVAYFFSEQKIVYLITFAGQKYRTGFTLERLEQLLAPALFFRINRQFIIHMSAIVKMIPASKSRLQVIVRPDTNYNTITSFGRTDTFYNWLLGGFSMP
ncbi:MULTISPECIES: LytR/AlgR family response regulator transcription factor [Niastella]|uniref:Response regulator transcription factor n=1 Tax=Niastella soli TaxID=2821487 RepID=A0ABS3YYK5_9BACT|nr:LytTR family DNA-binding domain-containing protein [Niastella soli]MBO9203009.1 response regulator transcription factor [Niastella soli]